MKLFSLPRRLLFAGKPKTMNHGGVLPKKTAKSLATSGPLATAIALLVFIGLPARIHADSLSEIQLISPQDSLAPAAGSIFQDSSTSLRDTVLQGSRSASGGDENIELENIVLLTKNIRANGWGEYEVGGRCLCCDNMLDGDCIIVHNTNRTEKKRIRQIVDGKIEADTSDESTYFGDLAERERSEHVTTLMAEITLNKQRDIHKVIVYTMADKVKKSFFISNCEVGYYDQFDRLQWAGKEQFEADDDRVTFELKKPIFTGTILIKTTGGKNRITEVGIFCKKSK